jgi:hypothetical protein
MGRSGGRLSRCRPQGHEEEAGLLLLLLLLLLRLCECDVVAWSILH